MFKWFDFLPRGLFTLKQLLTQYGLLYGQMSLCHTFSPVLHYTDSVTSSDTPIKAIQAKHCSSFLCWWDLLQSISVKFPLCLSTPVEISSFSFRIIGSKHYYKWTTDNLPFKDGICFFFFIYLKARQFSPTQDCLEIHMLKNSPMLGPMPGSRCIMGCHCDTHSNYELWIIWDLTTPAAAMLVLRPARQAKSVWWWLVGVASNSCTLLCAPQYFPPHHRPFRALPRYRDGASTPGIKT